MTCRHFLTALVLLLVFVTISAPMPAFAVCPSFPHTVPVANVADLINSIVCANSNTTDDVINLTSSTYTLTGPYSGDDGLPAIAPAASAKTLTINGNGALIQRSGADGTPAFRFFTLNSGANLTL